MNKMTRHSTFGSLPEPERMRQALGDRLPGFGRIEWLPVTGSTNTDLGESLRAGTPSTLQTLPWLRGAHLQTAGKGRAGRAWANQPGQCLMFSVAMDSPVPIAALMGLPPVLGITAVLALRKLLGSEVHHRLTLKWPNDLLWDQAKLAGILVEIVKHPSKPHPTIVAGIGLNLAGASHLAVEMARPIADWTQVSQSGASNGNHQADAAMLVASIALAWSNALKHVAQTGFGGFLSDFQSMDALAGQPVAVTDQGVVLLEGVASGCDESGRLLLATAEGMRPVMVGDVSVRPMPGALVRDAQ